MTRRTRSPWPDRIAVAKDLILFGVGTALIIRQGFVVPAQEFNLSAMIFGGIVGGVPGVIELWRLRSGSPSSIEGSPSEDPPPSSPSLPSPSSSA